MKQTPTTKLYSDGEDLTPLRSIGLAKLCTSKSSSANQIKGKTTENAGNLVHGHGVLVKSLEKVAGEADKMERMEDGQLN